MEKKAKEARLRQARLGHKARTPCHVLELGKWSAVCAIVKGESMVSLPFASHFIPHHSERACQRACWHEGGVMR